MIIVLVAILAFLYLVFYYAYCLIIRKYVRSVHIYHAEPFIDESLIDRRRREELQAYCKKQLLEQEKEREDKNKLEEVWFKNHLTCPVN